MTATLPDRAANASAVNASTVIESRHALPAALIPTLPVDPPAGAVEPKPKPRDKRIMALRRFALSITAFNVIGHLVLGFEQAPITPIACVLAGYLVDLVLETLDARALGRRPAYLGGGARGFVDYLLPTHIAGLACGMLLYANESLWPYLLAVTFAVASKHFIRIRVNGRHKHFLNPSNSGIVLVLLVFPWVSIAPPYHFTNNTTGTLDWILPLGVLMAGSMLNAGLTGKLPLILGWLGGFVAQAVLRWFFLDHHLLAALAPMTGLAFILFTNYMITDPGTTPFRRRNQVVFGVTAALLYGLLVVSHVVFGLFFALVGTCVLRAVVLLAAAPARRLVESWRSAPAPAPVLRPAVGPK